jgi:hypothetical protein
VFTRYAVSLTARMHVVSCELFLEGVWSSKVLTSATNPSGGATPLSCVTLHVPFALEFGSLAPETVFASLESSLLISFARSTDMDLFTLVRLVQAEAEAMSSGDEVTRTRLLHAIHKLTFAAETPNTNADENQLSRTYFQSRVK